MFHKSLLVFLCLLVGQTNIQSEEKPGKEPKKAEVSLDKPNEVDGLKLPAPFEVPYDEGFVTIKAECSGEVEWIVMVDTGRIKYKTSAKENEIDVSIPPKDTIITVFCYGLAGGKLTKAARTEVKVTGNPGPVTNPKLGQGAGGLPAVSYYATVVEDPLRRTADYVSITQWLATRDRLKAAGHKPSLLTTNDKMIKDQTTGFSTVLSDLTKQGVGLPVLIVQDAQGRLISAGPCPKTADEIMKLVGGK